MVAIVTGKGAGLERSSAWVLGSRGQLGSATLGRDQQGVYVNAANGNLVISRQDEFLIGRGPDVAVGRTYNSQAAIGDSDNSDNWQAGTYRRIVGANGAATVIRQDWDGSETVYSQTSADHYRATDGAGAYDTLTFTGGQWLWEDGDTTLAETYHGTNGRLLTTTDSAANTITYSYDAGTGTMQEALYANGDKVKFVYGGAGNLQLQRLETWTGGASPSVTRVRYAYETYNVNQTRLISVTVDLSPADNQAGDPQVYTTSYTYDGSSKRVASISQSDGSSVSFVYDGSGRIIQYTQAVSAGVSRTTSFLYEAGRTTITDPAGLKTALWYNGNGELEKIVYPPEDPLSQAKIVQFAYTAAGDVQSATLGPGNRIDYQYDTRGNRTLERDSAGNTITRTYSDPKNELLTETHYLVADPDGAGAQPASTPLTARYVYDSGSRLKYRVSAEGDVAYYEYDGFGQRTVALEFTGQSYSLAGLGPTDLIPIASLDSWMAAIADKSGARRTEWTYTTRGAVATETSYAKLLAGGAFDTASERSQANYVYDQAGNLLSRTITGAAGSEVFVYDGLNRMVAASDFNGNATRTYFADASGQTVVTHANGLAEISTYDKAGELISVSQAEPGANLINLAGWPGNPASPPAGQATVSGWMNPSAYTDETQWASTMGPNGTQVVAIRAGQLDTSLEGGGNYTHEVSIDATKAYEFVYYFKLSDLNKHAIYFGLSQTAPATVENLDGTDNTNPYFFSRWITDQIGTFTADKWYKVVGYVLPQGASAPASPPGGVYDAATGQKILDVTNFRWNAERPGNSVHSRFFDYYGEASLQYSTYFYQPEIRQVSTATFASADVAVTQYRYDSLGRLRMTIDPTGRSNYFLYDRAGRKVADVDTDGTVTEYRYDGSDNVTSTTTYATRLLPNQLTALANFDSGGGGGGGATGSNLLTNPSFDTSGSYTATATGRSNTDLPGWAKANAETFEQVASGQLGVAGTDGAYWLDLDSVPSGGVAPTGSNLLTNGSFDTSGSYSTIATGRSNTDLPGWTKTNAETFEQVTSGQLGVTGTNGAFWLDLESVPGTGLAPTGSNLVVNGSFDTSGSYTTTATGRSNTNLPGWNKTNPETFEQVASGQLGVTGTDGAYWLDLDSVPGPGGGYTPIGTNRLVNGSFDQSGTYTTTATGRANTNLSGWTKTNPDPFEQVTSGQLGVTGTDGAYWLDLDSVPTGTSETPGANLVALGGWPTNPNNLPSGNATVAGWLNPTEYVSETIWASVPPPGGGANVVAMRAGQVDADPYGGANRTNAITIDATKKYEFTYYFRVTSVGKHDIGMGLTASSPPYVVNTLYGDGGYDPYFLGMTAAQQAGYGLVANKWYKVVGYVLPQGSANIPYGSLGGVYDAATGAKIADVMNFRWNAGRPNNTVYSRMGVGNGTSNIMYSTDFLQPEIRQITSTPSGGGNMDISQTVADLEAGQVMQLQFDHANRTGGASGNFEVYWNGALVATIADTGATMQSKTYQFAAVAGNNVLRFKGLGTADAAGASIDNVRLFATQPVATGGNMDINQTIAGLTAGQTLQLQYDYANRTSSGSGSFEVYWNDLMIDQINSTGSTMLTKTLQVTAIGGNNVLRFKGIGLVDAAGASIDNVRLYAMATPVGGGNMDISQTVGGLTAGATMQLQFDHANRTSAASGSFEVYWNNALVATITDTGTTMQTKTYNVTALAGNNVLRFKGTGTIDAAGASIDNVRLYATAPLPNGGNMDISQTVPGLTAGQSMQLQFDHANRTGGASGNFEVYWNGALVATIADTSATMQTKTYTLTAVGGNNVLRFKGTGTVDAAGASIDNVRLKTIAPPGYGSLGSTIASIRPTGIADDVWTWNVYDLAQRLVQTIDGTGATSVYNYDGDSRLVSTRSYANRLDAATIASLKATALMPNQWVNAAGNWHYYSSNLSAVAASPIDGANAYQFTVINNGQWQSIYTTGVQAYPGMVETATITVKAVGSLTADSFGIYGAASGWGASADSSLTILSGPGTVSAQDGSWFFLTGLSTTEATRFTITRTFRQSEWSGPYFYLSNSSAVAGESTIVSAPIHTATNSAPILPTADAANDRLVRNFYDKDGLLIGTLDGEGYLTEHVYDRGGLEVRSVAYAAAASAALRESGSFAQLLASVLQNGSTNWWGSPNDASAWGRWGLQAPEAAGTIDGYNAFKLTVSTPGSAGATYAGGPVVNPGETMSVAVSIKAVGTLTSITLGEARSSDWSFGPDDYSTAQIISGPGTLTRVSGSLWRVSGLSTTEATRVIITKKATASQTEYPHLYVGYESPPPAGAALILANPVLTRGNADDIETRFLYDARGKLRAEVDGEGGLTRYRYNAAGALDQVISGQKLAGVDTSLAPMKYSSIPDAAGGTILDTVTSLLDNYGKATSATRNLGGAATTTTTFTYDNMGRLTSTTTQSGGADPRKQSLRYDLRGRLTGEMGGLGNSTLSAASSQSQIDAAYANYGTSFVYDAAGREISTTDANGNRTLYYYDSDGGLVFLVNPLGEVTETRFNALGQTTDTIVYAKRIAPATLPGLTGGDASATILTMMGNLATSGEDSGVHLDFNVDGTVSKSTDPLGNFTIYSYNAFREASVVNVPLDGRTIQTVNGYDRRGLIKTAVINGTITTSYGYDAFGRAITLTNALGKVASSTYDRAGRLRTETRSPDGGATLYTTTYTYDARDNLVAVTDALGKITRHVYDKANREIATIDALGGVVATTYDADGRVLATRAYFIAVDPNGLPLEVTETALALPANHAADQVTRFSYDKDGRLRFAIDALMHVAENVYDDLGNVIRTVAYDGAIATDPSGAYAESWVAAAVLPLASASGTRTSRTVYDAASRAAYTVDPIGEVAAFTYDSKGQLTKQVEYAAPYTSGGDPSASTMNSWRDANANGAADRTSRAFYDRKGQLNYSIDALGFVTRLDYDKLGNVISSTRFADPYSAIDTTPLSDLVAAFASPPASARTTSFTYDGAGRLEQTIDAEGYVTKLALDALGQILTSTAAFGTGAASITAFSYDDVGRVTKQVLGSGTAEVSTDWFFYDALGRQRASVDGDNYLSVCSYDAAGNRLSETRYGNAITGAFSTTSTVAALQALAGTSSIDATTSAVYDAFGRTISATDARGTITTRSYDLIDRQVGETQLLAGTGGDITTTYTYDHFGDVVKVHDARGFDSFAYYDKLGRVFRKVDAEKFVTDTTYTRGSQVATVKRWANRAPDPFSETQLPANPTADPLHDAVTSFTYNRRDEVIGVQDAQGFTESYGLNAFGERISLLNKVGATTTYEYFKRGLLKSETLPVTTKKADGTVIGVKNSFQYDERGNRIRMIEADLAAEARTTNYSYDKLDRMVTTSGDAVTIVNEDLTSTAGAVPLTTIRYDRRGNAIETIVELGATDARTLAWYDGLGRKIAEASPVGAVTRWTYDGNGNVASMKVFGTAIALPADATGPAPSPAGESRETLYGYDRANRLTSIATANMLTGEWTGASWAFANGTVFSTREYDAAGNVTHEEDGRGNDIYSWYDKLGRKTAQVDAENYLTAWTLDANGNALAETRYATKLGAFTPGAAPPGVSASANDRTTIFDYDRNGRRTEEKRLAVAYTSVTAAGGAGDVVATDASAVSKVNYTYNGLGLILTKTEANLADIAVSTTARETVTYLYDGTGRLTLETDQSFTGHDGAAVTPRTAYAYDGLNNITSVRVMKDAVANDTNDRVTTNTYGPGGRLATTTDAAGFQHSYGYDLAGRTVRDRYERVRSDGSSVFEAQVVRYDLAGRATIQTLARDTGSSWLFTNPAGAAYDAIRTRYNAYGEVSGRGVTAGPGAPEVYQEFFDYDLAGRLWRSNSGDGALHFFVYDKAGNRTLTLTSAGAANLSQLDVTNYAGSITGTGDTNIQGAVTTIAVFDKRGQQIQTREPDRQFSAAAASEIVTAKAYNAYGEVISETDALSRTTSFTYNAMGRLLSRVSPQVTVTEVDGSYASATPTETYGYDLAGRLVSVTDENGYRTSRLLLAGTGHGEEDPLVTKEFHPDTGIVQTKYDVFGDARAVINEVASTETRDYDKLGQLTAVTRPLRVAGSMGNPGGSDVQLIDSYAYDGLGQRIQHWNSYLGVAVKERTDYDAQGRVSATIGFGGDTTSYIYGWDPNLVTGGLGGFGGWAKTTYNAAGLSMTERQDYFGRTIDQIDFGYHDYDFTFDFGGRLVARSNGAGESIAFTYYTTGMMSGQTGTQGVAGFEYDAVGNRKKETFVRSGVSYRNAEANYDALNRMTYWSDSGAYGGAPASASWEYDRAGNVRYTESSSREIDLQGNVLGPRPAQGYWYLYDQMNRFTLTKGILNGPRGAGTIEIGESGSQIEYYLDGNRRSALYSAVVGGSRWAFMSGGGPWGGPGFEIMPDGTGNDGDWVSVPFGFQGLRRETYFYTADGYLAATYKADSWVDPGPQPADTDQMPPEMVFHDPTGAGTVLSSMTLDAMGRTTYYKEWGGLDGTYERTNITYDNAGRQLSETTNTLRADNAGGAFYTYVTNVNFYYSTAGLLTAQTQDTYKALWGQTPQDNAVDDSRVEYGYSWWDGALQTTIQNDKNWNGSSFSPDWTTTFSYDGSGRTSSVYIADGRPRTVSLVTDQNGMIVERDENDSQSGGDPRTLRYFFGGVQLGVTSNNGTDNMQYVASIHDRLAALSTSQQNGAFRGGSTAASPFADFEQSYDAINGGAAQVGSSYVVNEGDTLQTIAQNVWGDSLLWYLIAQANGLSGGEPLAAGMVLTIPNKVHNSHNNSETFRPYNPNEALGDTSPTSIKKPKKIGACGIIARIIAMAIQFAVSKLIPIPIVGDVLGNVASQAFLIAVGQQKKFDWKSVAITALTAGLSFGLSKIGGPISSFMSSPAIGGSQFAGQVVKAVALNVAVQGISVATGLQKKFDWVGVAAAGVGAAAGNLASGGLNPVALTRHTLSFSNIMANLGTAGASAFAKAGTRSLLSGTSFGDNIIAVLPDVIGNTIGEVLYGRIAGGAGSAQSSASVDGDGIISGAEQSDTYLDQLAAARVVRSEARVARIRASLEPGDEGNPLMYSLSEKIPLKVKRYLWKLYQAGDIKFDMRVSRLPGRAGQYNERVGANGLMEFDEVLLRLTGHAQRGADFGAMVMWTSLEEQGHQLDAMAWRMMGVRGGDSPGDEGGMFAHMMVRDMDPTQRGRFRYNLGDIASFDVDSTTLRMISMREVATGGIERENRINGIEYYGPAGHYYTSFMVGFGVLNLGLNRNVRYSYGVAQELAFGSQLPDMVESLDAYSLFMNFWVSPQEMRDKHSAFHTLPYQFDDPGAIERIRGEIGVEITNHIRAGHWADAGLAIHALGDAYAHTRMWNGNELGYRPGLGHMRSRGDHGHEVDNMFQDGWSRSKIISYTRDLAGRLLDGFVGVRPDRDALITRSLRDWNRLYNTQSRATNEGDFIRRMRIYEQHIFDHIPGGTAGLAPPLDYGSMDVGGNTVPPRYERPIRDRWRTQVK